MARMNGLEKMSYAELVEAETEIARLKVGKQNAERAQVRQKLLDMAKEAGFEISDLFGKGARKGKTSFVLDARAELTPETKGLITKYGLGSLVVYDSKARQQRAEQAAGNFDAAYVQSYGSVGKSLWSNAKGIASAAMMALSLRVTVNNLMNGQHIECKDLDELLGAEGAIVEACKNLKAYIETALTFDGREELLEF